MFFKSFDCISRRIPVLIENFIALNVKTIYNTVKVRPEDFRNFVFFRKRCIIFNEYHFFTFKCLFSEAWFYSFPERVIIGSVFYVKVIIKFVFVFLMSTVQKLRRLLYAHSLINKFFFPNLFRSWVPAIIIFWTLLVLKGSSLTA